VGEGWERGGRGVGEGWERGGRGVGEGWERGLASLGGVVMNHKAHAQGPFNIPGQATQTLTLLAPTTALQQKKYRGTMVAAYCAAVSCDGGYSVHVSQSTRTLCARSAGSQQGYNGACWSAGLQQPEQPAAHLYFPEGQGVHTEDAGILLKVPAGHGVHTGSSSFFDVSMKVPIPQVHDATDLLPAGEYGLSSGHVEHLLDPARLYVPEAQVSHRAPLAVLWVPAPQTVCQRGGRRRPRGDGEGEMGKGWAAGSSL
jgi:hypothetical protein